MLNDAIGGLLPSALAVALSPIPIVAIVLVLGAPNARMAGPALAVGWIAGLLSVSVIVVLLVGSGDDPNSDDPGLNWLNIAIGTLFLLMAAKQSTKRPNRYIRVSDASGDTGSDSSRPSSSAKRSSGGPPNAAST